MTYQEALDVVPGTSVLYRGRSVEVLSIDRRGPSMVYFKLTGVAEPQHFASIYFAVGRLRMPSLDGRWAGPRSVHIH